MGPQSSSVGLAVNVALGGGDAVAGGETDGLALGEWLRIDVGLFRAAGAMALQPASNIISNALPVKAFIATTSNSCLFGAVRVAAGALADSQYG